jgi:hypothetical protein
MKKHTITFKGGGINDKLTEEFINRYQRKMIEDIINLIWGVKITNKVVTTKKQGKTK